MHLFIFVCIFTLFNNSFQFLLNFSLIRSCIFSFVVSTHSVVTRPAASLLLWLEWLGLGVTGLDCLALPGLLLPSLALPCLALPSLS